MNPLTTPLRTSIELNVFPVMGIINTIKAKYKDGILTEPNSGKSRFESYAPNKSIGAAQNASATGLNQPPIVFLSSIIPTEKPRIDVRIIAKISEIGKKKYNVISDATIPISMEMPPGRGTMTLPFLLASLTVRLRFSKNLIKIGVKA